MASFNDNLNDLLKYALDGINAAVDGMYNTSSQQLALRPSLHLPRNRSKRLTPARRHPEHALSDGREPGGDFLEDARSRVGMR